MSFGHDVTLLCRPDGWLQDNVGADISFVESELNRSPFELRRMANWIKANGIELIHTHMSRAHSFGVLMRMMTGVPVVATAHACSFQVHWRMNDFVIANSQSTYDYHRRVNRVSRHKMEKVFCFTDMERFKRVTRLDQIIVRREMRLSGNEFLVGVVGDVLARKGQIHLIRALPEIIEAVPNFQLVMLGRFRRNENYVKKIRALQHQHNLYRRIKWLGLRTNVQDFMSVFDLCVVPSIQEPLGLVALESLAAGTPVVASRTGGLPEIVRPGENGILVPPKNPRELAKAIIEMAQSKTKRERLGENGRMMVERDFATVPLAHDIEAIFNRIIETHSSRRFRRAG